MEQNISNQLIIEQLQKLLTERGFKIIVLRYGLEDSQPKTLQFIGNLFGISRECIQQLEVKTMKKIKVKAPEIFLMLEELKNKNANK